ncbi:MAG: hypothetical protein EX271_12140 [Acidimicrobiales bacterium]|nr:MAG: hypothetical protein EX271_12140 [Acidimicrobiales bacterium]
MAESFISTVGQQFYETDYHPAYDREFLEWQLNRCPPLKCFSYVGDNGVTAVAWYIRRPTTDWRMIFRQTVLNSVDLEKCLQSAKALAFDEGADSIKVLISQEDTQQRTTLLNNGFTQGENYYFYSFSRPGELPAECMSGLSFLDVDFAYL